MNEKEKLLWEIERRGGRITTHELHQPGMPLQYQRALKELREKLALRGWVLTEGQAIQGRRRNYLYRLIKPGHQQLDFGFEGRPDLRRG